MLLAVGFSIIETTSPYLVYKLTKTGSIYGITSFSAGIALLLLDVLIISSRASSQVSVLCFFGEDFPTIDASANLRE